MRVVGFAKVRNELVREGNLYRLLAELERLCDGGIVCDDASSDGTAQVLREWVAKDSRWKLVETPAAEQAFEREMAVKQRMIEALRVHVREQGLTPDWVLWLDADETVAASTEETRGFLAALPEATVGVRCHYTQLWRTRGWARTDDGFDDGTFIKFWRWSEALSFVVKEGTHHNQFPAQIEFAACPQAPFDVIHWGNFGKNIVWKAIQYADGRGGVDRHIAFGHDPSVSLATGKGFDEPRWSKPHPTYRPLCTSPGPMPQPFAFDEIRTIRSMLGLHRVPGWFTVIVPAFNRADTLPRALDSLIAQTHKNWIAFVLDDGSTDSTSDVMRLYQDRDPRVFYARYLVNRGGVAMNEIGMALAVEMTEYWTRLGSDDWFGPRKLELDAVALRQVEACFGSFQVEREGRLEELCNPSLVPGETNKRLSEMRFVASWANAAVRSATLEAVRSRYGSFCDPRLRNMEDFLVNMRVGRVAKWAWRGLRDGTIMVDPPEENLHGSQDDMGFWRCVPTGGASASANAALTGQEDALTRAICKEQG